MPIAQNCCSFKLSKSHNPTGRILNHCKKYLIGFKFAPGEILKVVTTQLKVDGLSNWQTLGTGLISDSDSVLQELGYFLPGSCISLLWVVRAESSINSVTVFLVNKDTREQKEIAPGNLIIRMNKGDDWGDEIHSLLLF